jgi:hypothetical protein
MGLLELSRGADRLSKEASKVSKGLGLLPVAGLSALGAGAGMAMTLPYDIKRGMIGMDPRYLAARRQGLVQGPVPGESRGGMFRGRAHLARELSSHGRRLSNIGSNW